MPLEAAPVKTPNDSILASRRTYARLTYTMPTYEYRCSACNHQYEKREGFDAPARQRCPKCRKAAIRVIQAPPIVFKGSGFYVTDSRGSPPSETASESKSTPDSTSTSTKASDKDAEPAAAG